MHFNRIFCVLALIFIQLHFSAGYPIKGQHKGEYSVLRKRFLANALRSLSSISSRSSGARRIQNAQISRATSTAPRLASTSRTSSIGEITPVSQRSSSLPKISGNDPKDLPPSPFQGKSQTGSTESIEKLSKKVNREIKLQNVALATGASVVTAGLVGGGTAATILALD